MPNPYWYPKQFPGQPPWYPPGPQAGPLPYWANPGKTPIPGVTPEPINLQPPGNLGVPLPKQEFPSPEYLRRISETKPQAQGTKMPSPEYLKYLTGAKKVATPAPVKVPWYKPSFPMGTSGAAKALPWLGRTVGALAKANPYLSAALGGYTVGSIAEQALSKALPDNRFFNAPRQTVTAVGPTYTPEEAKLKGIAKRAELEAKKNPPQPEWLKTINVNRELSGLIPYANESEARADMARLRERPTITEAGGYQGYWREDPKTGQTYFEPLGKVETKEEPKQKYIPPPQWFLDKVASQRGQ